MKKFFWIFILLFMRSFIAQGQFMPIHSFSGKTVRFKHNSDSIVYIKNSCIVIPPILAFNNYSYRDSISANFRSIGMFGGNIKKYFIEDSIAFHHFKSFQVHRGIAMTLKGLVYPGMIIAMIDVANRTSDQYTEGPPPQVVTLLYTGLGAAFTGSVFSFIAKAKLKKAINRMRTR